MSARSRMRTKYGSQLQIQEISDLLTDDEKLLMMAVATGPTQPDRHNHGLLALTDQRILFVSRTEPAPVELVLATVSAFLWTKTGRTGALSVISAADSPCFSDLTSPDGREFMAAAVRSNPRIKRIEHAPSSV